MQADERVVDVTFTKDTLSVALRDGRTITVPLVWYPRFWTRRPRNGKDRRLLAAVTASIGRTLTKTSTRKDFSAERRLHGSLPTTWPGAETRG